MIDFTPATVELARIATGVRDDQLSLPTPCPDWAVADLLDHVDGLAQGFAGAARKDSAVADQAPQPDGANLGADWRDRIPLHLQELAAAWSEPTAWEGRTTIAGVESSASENAGTALDEVLVHSWDLARATGQEFSVDQPALGAAQVFADAVASFAPDGIPGLFGARAAGDTEPGTLEHLLVTTGRDPGWAPAAG